MENKIKEIINGLNECEKERLIKDGFTNECFFDKNGNLTKEHKWYFKEKTKYFYLNVGGSGAFMVDKNGEIFNIKSYGTIDKNKKLKADLGNINKVDVKVLHSKRWNYLR